MLSCARTVTARERDAARGRARAAPGTRLDLRARMRPLPVLPLLLLTLIQAACSDHDDSPAPVANPRPVSLQVEVYDPESNLVWENMGVQIVQSENEWSNCLCPSQNEVLLFTDATGSAFFSPRHIALAQVGFQEDIYGRALLGPAGHEDEAVVTIEVGHPDLGFLYFPVLLSYAEPDVFVSVPFAATLLRARLGDD